MFAQGDLIVYGGEGVCKVESIGAPQVNGANKDRLYYTLAPLYRTGKVFAPVDSGVFMRPVITRDEAIELIRSMPEVIGEVYENRNLRFLTEHYQQALSRYECSGLVKLIKDVYVKRTHMNRQGKKLGQIDERYMKRAEEMLYGELAVALDIDRSQVPGYIASTIEQAGDPECDSEEVAG